MKNWILLNFVILASCAHSFNLRTVKIQMGDQKGDGMDGGVLRNVHLGGGRFELKICSGEKSCCSTGYLNTEDDNWQRGEVNYFVGRQLGQCENFPIVEGVNVTLQHTGNDGGRIVQIFLWSSNRHHGNHVECQFHRKLDHDESGVADCKFQEKQDFRGSCNGSPQFCQLQFNQVTFAGAHNAGTGMSPVPALGCFYKNQDLSVTEMLDFGIRFLDFDSKISDDKLYTGHGPKSVDVLYKNFGLVKDAILEVKTWMTAHPNEVVVLYFGELLGDRLKGLKELKNILAHELPSRGCADTVCINTQWQDTKKWPSLGDAIDANRRIFVFARINNPQELELVMDESHDIIPEQAFKSGTKNANWGSGNVAKILSSYNGINIGSKCEAIPSSAEQICREGAQEIPDLDLVKVAIFGTHNANSITNCLWTMARRCNAQIQNAIDGCRKSVPIVNFLQSDYPNFPGEGKKTTVEIAEEENFHNLRAVQFAQFGHFAKQRKSDSIIVRSNPYLVNLFLYLI